jgi:hypothetical protein
VQGREITSTCRIRATGRIQCGYGSDAVRVCGVEPETQHPACRDEQTAAFSNPDFAVLVSFCLARFFAHYGAAASEPMKVQQFAFGLATIRRNTPYAISMMTGTAIA